MYYCTYASQVTHVFLHPNFCLGEVERLMRDYKQNQDLVRNLGSRYYQVIYPIQVRHREMVGVSTREASVPLQENVQVIYP